MRIQKYGAKKPNLRPFKNIMDFAVAGGYGLGEC